jgi:flagellin
MSMVINTNIMSITAQNNLSKTQMSLQTAMQRLSSGLKINSAADNAAGLAIADRMNSQINGMGVAQQNANDAISMAQTAESGMGNITDTLQTMRDLAVQAANFGTTTTSDRQKMQVEFQQLGAEVKRIIQNTQFNGKAILNGSLVHANFQVGANMTADNRISVNISNMIKASGLGSIISIAGASGIGSAVGTNSTWIQSVTNTIDTAIATVDRFRSTLGALQNRFTTTIANLQSSQQNQSAAYSRIMDTDFAATTSSLSRAQILQQAGTAMLTQANQSNQSVLSLLR